MREIRSRENPRIKRLRSLARSAKDRRQQGLTVLDGPHLLGAALDAKVELLEVWVSESGLTHPEIQALLQRCPASIERFLLADTLFGPCSPVDSPSGVLTVMTPLPLVPIHSHGNWLVLDRIQDPGNLGTLLRTAAAAGIAQALLTPGCAQAWSPKVLRAAMGAHFVLPIHEQVDVIAALDTYGGEVIATGLQSQARSLYDVDLGRDVAWLFGAEGEGLSPALFERARQIVTIPMKSGCESLNVAAAAAVCLFEQHRQQGAGR